MTQCIGKVDKNGVKKIGDNFLCKRKYTGYFRVDFDNDLFKSEPVILVTADTSEKGEKYTVAVSLHDVSKDGFSVSIESLNCNHRDVAFNFSASSNIN